MTDTGTIPVYTSAHDDIDMVLVEESEFFDQIESVKQIQPQPPQPPLAAAATVIQHLPQTISHQQQPSHVGLSRMMHLMGGSTVAEDRPRCAAAASSSSCTNPPSPVPAAAAMTNHTHVTLNQPHSKSHDVSNTCARDPPVDDSCASFPPLNPVASSLSISHKLRIKLIHRQMKYEQQQMEVINYVYQAWFAAWSIPLRQENALFLRQFTLPVQQAEEIYRAAVSLMHIKMIGATILNRAERVNKFVCRGEREFYCTDEFGDELLEMDVRQPDIVGYMGLTGTSTAYYCVHPDNKIGQRIGRLLDQLIQQCPMGLPAFLCHRHLHSSKVPPSSSSTSASHSHSSILINPDFLDADSILQLPIGVYVKFQHEIRSTVGVDVNLTWLAAILFLHLVARLKEDSASAARNSSGFERDKYSMQHHKVNKVALWGAKLNRMPYSINLESYAEAPRMNHDLMRWLRESRR